jgi:thiol-disulfide isomerase/thioredoxin
MLPLSVANSFGINEHATACTAILEEDHQSLNFEKYKGKVIYLDFWATWCPPCKKSMPFLNSLRNELFGLGFEVIAISVDEEPEDARKYLHQFPVDYVIAMDPSGQCPQQYNVMAMPSAYLLDRQGKIRHIHLGFRESDEAEIRQQVMQLLAENEGNE